MAKEPTTKAMRAQLSIILRIDNVKRTFKEIEKEIPYFLSILPYDDGENNQLLTYIRSNINLLPYGPFSDEDFLKEDGHRLQTMLTFIEAHFALYEMDKIRNRNTIWIKGVYSIVNNLKWIVSKLYLY